MDARRAEQRVGRGGVDLLDREVAEETLWKAKQAMKLDFFPRRLAPR